MELLTGSFSLKESAETDNVRGLSCRPPVAASRAPLPATITRAILLSSRRNRDTVSAIARHRRSLPPLPLCSFTPTPTQKRNETGAFEHVARN